MKRNWDEDSEDHLDSLLPACFFCHILGQGTVHGWYPYWASGISKCPQERARYLRRRYEELSYNTLVLHEKTHDQTHSVDSGGASRRWSRWMEYERAIHVSFHPTSSQDTELVWAGSARLMRKALNWKCFGFWFRQNRIILIHQSEFKMPIWDIFYLKVTRTLWDLLETSWGGWCESTFRTACLKAVVGKKAETWLYSTELVTESGVQLLIAQKPIKRQGWWKVKFALFWMPAI